jgi:hypothetical protein
VADGSERPNRSGPTGHLQRVPPHDTQTEKALLGAALLNRDAAAVVAKVDPYDFYYPPHQVVASAIAMLVEEGVGVDPGTVAALLRAQGQLDGINGGGAQGASYLIAMQADCPSTGTAPNYAEWVERYARQRKMLRLFSDGVDAVYKGIPVEGLVAEMVAATEAGLIGVESSWDIVNLAATLAGEDGDEHPCYLERTDGVPLLYPGKVHAFNAESETGKSMLAIWACAERLHAGEHVGYIDFEDSPRGVVDRLLGFGIDPGLALERFHYIRPDDPIDAGAKLRIKEMLRVFPVTLVVIDGVAEALALSGWDENAASDIAKFYNTLPRAISREGVTVILIDHLPKDRERQGNDARGSGAKRAGIDGASFKLETVSPFVRGGSGVAKVLITKDRPGWVRPSAAGKAIAEMFLTSDDNTGALTCELRPPKPSTDDSGNFRPTGYMERVSKALEASSVAVSRAYIERETGGNRNHIRAAIDRLHVEGYLAIERQGQALLHSLMKPYREPSNREEDF